MTADAYVASGGVGNPQSWNRYAYVENDPVNFTDRSGLQKDICGEEMADTDWCRAKNGHWEVRLSGGSYFDNSSERNVWLGLVTNVWVTNGPGGGSGGGVDAALAATDAAKADLSKNKCFGLLGFTSAADAQKWFDSIRLNELSKGRLQKKDGAPVGGGPGAADTLGFGTINLNTDHNWADLSKVATSTGGTYDFLGFVNRMYGTTMNSEQLGALIVIHELRHQNTAPKTSDSETLSANKKIYDNCVK